MNKNQTKKTQKNHTQKTNNTVTEKYDRCRALFALKSKLSFTIYEHFLAKHGFDFMLNIIIFNNSRKNSGKNSDNHLVCLFK